MHRLFHIDLESFIEVCSLVGVVFEITGMTLGITRGPGSLIFSPKTG